MFHGSLVALVTPFKENKEIDEYQLKKLVEFHLEQGTDGLVLNGTTGESVTLNFEEQIRIVQLVVEITCGRVPIIVGCGTPSTQETLYRAQRISAMGIDACLIVTPSYNRPTQEGLYQHYKMIAENVSIPIILYNVPSRTACDLLPETILRLSDIPNIVGLKEAVSDMDRIKALMSSCADKINLYSGDDASALSFILQGGKGVISVTANVAPKMMHQMCKAALNRELNLAGEINAKLMPLHKLLFVESNPIPTKWALSALNLCPEYLRLPLTPLSEIHHPILKEALENAGLFDVTGK
ncbi:MAG: dihydrodipicolinate synthase [Francisellaceae bacterium]|nr:dihydrodipicolinate synthase [Francisellaceae bacterium]